MWQVWFGSTALLLLGFLVGWLGCRVNWRRRVTILEGRVELYKIAKQEHADRCREWEEKFEEAVRRRVDAQLKDWFPDENSLDEDFSKAETMAIKREMLDAGRTQPVRKDGGPNASVHKIRIRKGRK